MVLLFSMISAEANTESARSFDLKAGDASESLKGFARQARVDIVYDAKSVEGIEMPKVMGVLPPREVLQLLLEGTGLVFKEDQDTGAIAITRQKITPGDLRNSNPNTTQSPMNDKLSLINPQSTRNPVTRFVGALLTVAVFSSPPVTAQEDNSDLEVFELSPFVIEESANVGYLATSTLAGTRIKTNLNDLGSSISVITTEFMEDTAATGMGSLLSYVSNAEVGGVFGNFSGAVEQQDSRYYDTDNRTNPQFNQRIRGLGSAALTRNYFLTDIPFDSYNTERVSINRGPNSLLFGIGNPGGVINNSTKRAIQRANLNKISLKVDSFGSFRTEMDFNRSIIQDKLAVRLAALYDDTKFKQEPAWNRDERIYGNLEWIVSDNSSSNILDRTIVRGSFESGTSKGSPPEVIPPTIAYHNWFEPISPDIENYTGSAAFAQAITPSDGGRWEFQPTYNPFQGSSESNINTTARLGVFRHVLVMYGDGQNPGIGDGNPDGFLGLIPWNAGKDTLDSAGLAGKPAVADLSGSTGLGRYGWYHANSPYGEPYAIGFAAPTLQNRDVFDYHNYVYSGGIDVAERNFEVNNIIIEQGFFNNRAGVEIAYDEQHYESTQDFFFAGGNGTSRTGPYDIYVDIVEFLPNGQSNPNLGRAYSRVARPQINHNEIDRETFRITAFGELDFSDKQNWLRFFGKHRFTGLYNSQSRENFFNGQREGWTSDTIDIASIVAGGNIAHFRRPVNVGVYVSDSLLGLDSMDQVRLHQINIQRPQVGQRYNIMYGDAGKSDPSDRGFQTGPVEIGRYVFAEDLTRTEIDSVALSWQSYLLNDHVIGLIGWRNDSTKSYGLASSSESGQDRLLDDGTYNPAYTQLSSAPSIDEDGDTITWSVVGVYPERLLGELPFDMDLRVHYAESENFNPVGLRNNALGRAIGQPSGTTTEYGFTFDFQKSKYSIKFNWFETKLQDISAGVSVNVINGAREFVNGYLTAEDTGLPFSNAFALYEGDPASFPIQSYSQFYDSVISIIPDELLSVVQPEFVDTNGNGIADSWQDRNPVQNLSSTRDRVAEGMEIELVANPTDKWRLMLNIARQETINDNTAPEMARLAEEFTAGLIENRLDELVYNPTGIGAVRPLNDRWVGSYLAPIRGVKALDGTISNEQREWRITAVTNYEFSDGLFKGTSIGGAVRWESEAATGYVYELEETTGVPVPIVSQPFFDDGLTSGDIWIAHNCLIFKGKVDWKIQLNIRNAFSDNVDIPVKTNPDGQIAVVRIPNQRTVTLTNTFSF